MSQAVFSGNSPRIWSDGRPFARRVAVFKSGSSRILKYLHMEAAYRMCLAGGAVPLPDGPDIRKIGLLATPDPLLRKGNADPNLKAHAGQKYSFQEKVGPEHSWAGHRTWVLKPISSKDRWAMNLAIADCQTPAGF